LTSTEDLESILREASALSAHNKEEKMNEYEKKEDSKEKRTGKRDSRELRILYVEDDPNDQMILRRSLEKDLLIDFVLTTANTGSEGLKKVEEDGFDLILLDYRLPGMTGLEFIDELRKKHSKISVILITAQGSEKIAVEAMKRGAQDYVTKDEIGSARLADIIRDIALESALSEEWDMETAKRVVSLLSESELLRTKVFEKSNLKPGSKICLEELISTLEKLTEAFSVLACPSCGSLTSTPCLRCPECRSLRIVKADTLEHLTCGCIDFWYKFERGEGELTCPSCGKKLGELGVDYRKVESWFRCSNDHLFKSPIFSFRCHKCDEEFNVETANLEKLYQYQLSEKGQPPS